uniref:Fam20C domain-containing protein n=1 Tax=Caenorhabditis japonica TaxID=281687 RepID=A0A8R1DW61_CAEJA
MLRPKISFANNNEKLNLGEWKNGPHLSEGRVIPSHPVETFPVGQKGLQNQPKPPSLSRDDHADPFNFSFSSNKLILRKLHDYVKNVNFEEMKKNECKKNLTLSKYWENSQQRYVPEDDSWEKFYSNIRSCSVYSDDAMVDKLLHDLNTMPIKNVHIMDGGTQVKFVFTFKNDKQAVFKPMRFGRDYESDPNHFYFSDFERHHAEIATFHLDRVLGFRRAIPTVGRVLNMTTELFEKAEKKLKKTFFFSPAKNFCFVSRCDYYCDTTHAICGFPDMKEGSVQVFLPDESAVPRKHNRNPYRRTYSKKNQIAEWQNNMNYCTDKVKTKQQYAHGRRLLDLVDLHVLDYLIGNQDRHHFESFNVFDNVPSYAIHLDHGRAFGRSDFDDDDILLPLRQCCIIRPSTFETLLKFYSAPKSLTTALHESMSKDPAHPILAYKHYPAIERRLAKVMTYILECFESRKVEEVLISEFHNLDVSDLEQNEEDQSEEHQEKNDVKKTV